MAWMETDYSKHRHFRRKIKWRLEHLGALGTMGETAPLMWWVELHFVLCVNLFILVCIDRIGLC